MGWLRSRLGGGGEGFQPLYMDCLVLFSHPDGEESGCATQYCIRPIVELGEQRLVAVATDQNAVGNVQRIRDGFQSLLMRCGVVAGLGPASGLLL